MGKKRRAMDERAKKARRAEIITAAFTLLQDTEDYDAVTMARIAKEAGVAKGTLYLYFETKEELFMEAMGDAIGDWFETWIEQIEALPSPASNEDVVHVMAALSDDPMLGLLFTKAYTTIEPNISAEVATRFKRRLRDNLLPLGELLERKLEVLSEPGDGFRFLMCINAVFLGVHQLTTPAPAAKKALQAIDLAMFRLDFVTEFTPICCAILRGWR